MLSNSNKNIWTSLSVLAVAISVLIFSVKEISCEHEIHKSIDKTSPDHALDSEDGSGVRFVRSIKATPLRWGKRNIDKRSTAEDDDGTDDDLVNARNTRASPLR